MNTAQILSDLKSGYETINCMGDFLTHFVESYPHSSHVREARTRKYLLANYREAISNGLESIDDLIGAIALENLLKIPISDRDNKKIVSFLTIFQDLTPQLPLQKLFDLYQTSFPF